MDTFKKVGFGGKDDKIREDRALKLIGQVTCPSISQTEAVPDLKCIEKNKDKIMNKTKINWLH